MQFQLFDFRGEDQLKYKGARFRRRTCVEMSETRVRFNHHIARGDGEFLLLFSRVRDETLDLLSCDDERFVFLDPRSGAPFYGDVVQHEGRPYIKYAFVLYVFCLFYEYGVDDSRRVPVVVGERIDV